MKSSVWGKINNMLRIKGTVIKGKQLGRELGFPTANLAIEGKLSSGVYAGEIISGNQKHKAAIFIPKEGNLIEAHIFDFKSDIYGEIIEVLIGKKIREVKKFQNNTELKEQIKKDLEIIKGIK